MAAEPCRRTFDAALEGLTIAPGEIESLIVTKEPNASGGSGSEYAVAYNAWVRLKACSGYLVLRTSGHCTYLGAVTTGACSREGLPHYP